MADAQMRQCVELTVFLSNVQEIIYGESHILSRGFSTGVATI